jgi:hypothetical protein
VHTDPAVPASQESEVIDTIELADGRTMIVRPTSAGDAERIFALYDDLSIEDRHRRFFGAFRPRLEWCLRWATVADRGGFGVIAVVSPGRTSSDEVAGETGPGEQVAGEQEAGEMAGEQVAGEEVAGEAGYAIRPDGDGDLAVTVATPWRGWLGPYLLDVLVRHAAAVGLSNLQADVLLENGPMLSLLRRRDPVAMGHEQDAVRLSIGTTGPVASWPSREHRPRVLVEVPGRRWAGEYAADSAGLATAMCAGPGGRTRSGCPVLEGGSCPLADAADAIVVLLDPDDERTQQLIDSHRRSHPGTPVLVRSMRSGHQVGAPQVPLDEGCVEIDVDPTRGVSQLLALIGPRHGAMSPEDDPQD